MKKNVIKSSKKYGKNWVNLTTYVNLYHLELKHFYPKYLFSVQNKQTNILYLHNNFYTNPVEVTISVLLETIYYSEKTTSCYFVPSHLPYFRPSPRFFVNPRIMGKSNQHWKCIANVSLNKKNKKTPFLKKTI
jgi:hypothetical protein